MIADARMHPTPERMIAWPSMSAAQDCAGGIDHNTLHVACAAIDPHEDHVPSLSIAGLKALAGRSLCGRAA